MRIVISGYFGFANIGDELILDATVALLEEAFEDPIISVITYPRGDLDTIRQRLGVTAVDGRDVAHCSALIGKADLLLIGGGGLIQDYLPAARSTLFTARHANLVFWISLATIARLHGTPVVGWELGIGPLKTEQGRQDAAMLLGQLDHAFVRDQESLDLARQMTGTVDGASLGADPAVTLPIERTGTKNRRLGVIVRSWLEEGDWLDAVAEALDDLDDPGLEIVFLPMQQTGRHLEDDLAASRAVMNRMRTPSSIIEPASPGNFVGDLASCTAVVTMRLHGALIALAAGIPVVALSYDPKVEQQMRRSGQERFVKSIHDVSADWLSDAITEALATGPLDNVLAEASGAVRNDVGRLAGIESSPGPLPTEIVEHLVAGREVEIAAARRDLEAELARSAQLEDRGRFLQAEVERLQAAAIEAENARSRAVAMYDELAGSRAVRLASSVWKARSAVTRRLRRQAR